MIHPPEGGLFCCIALATVVLGCSAEAVTTSGRPPGSTKATAGTTSGAGGAGGSGGGGTAGGSGSAGSAGSGGSGSFDAGRRPDSGTGTASCLEVQQCENNCRGSQSCRANCVAMGTAEAQNLRNMLRECISTNCANSTDPACTCNVQCQPSGPCRTLDEMCVGASPDPDCAGGC